MSNKTNPKKCLIIMLAFLISMGRNANADFTFGTPTTFDEPVNSTGIEYFGCISADGLEVYIDKPVSGGITSHNWDIYMSTRETINDPWSVPVSVGPTVNKGYVGGYESLSSDGLELWFSSRRPGGYGQQDIWVTTRDSKVGDWGAPVNLGPPINTSSSDLTPWITPDGLELYFSSDRPGGYGVVDIWVATRTTTNDEWGEPVNLGPNVNGPGADYGPSISNDGLVLVYYRFGPARFLVTTRKSIDDDWGPAVDLGINNPWTIYGPALSPDGSTIYFDADSGGDGFGSNDIWQVSILPVVDFNTDGVVDSADVCMMVDNWLTDEPLYDIAPLPYGDGIVDVKDLILLAEHLTMEVDDPNEPNLP